MLRPLNEQILMVLGRSAAPRQARGILALEMTGAAMVAGKLLGRDNRTGRGIGPGRAIEVP
jgi:hypothetical protein